MDTDRFDALTRAVGSRRGILAAALGGITLVRFIADATAKKRRKKRCGRIKYRHRPDTCYTFKTNKCGGKKTLKCQTGKICLANKTCGLDCAATECPADLGCICSMSEPKVCLAPFTACEEVPTACTSTADCPFYSVCDDAPCGEGDATETRCLPLCGYAAAP
jgi:hypothetical protein